MLVALKYIIGITLFGVFAFLAVRSIMSLIATVRAWLEKRKSKKSPAEGEKVEVDKTDTDASGKEVDK